MKKLLGLIIMFAFCFELNANNLQISPPEYAEIDIGLGQVKLQFDISWDNSWRTSSAPNNWDAVWLFVKYKKASDGKWYHATLNTTAANHSTGSQGGGAILSPRADGIGAYYYRSGNGSGTFSSTSVKLCWNYAADGLGNNLSEEIIGLKVFGIEMVYIPQGAFYVGSGGSESGHFYTYGGNNPYQITSEGAINAGQTNGYLWAAYYIETSSIPAAFPKGYDAFYCMKYEITQEQYVHFLNTLTRTQQNSRTETNLASGITSIGNRWVMVDFSWPLYRNGICCDAIIHPTNPITFYSNFNVNEISNEANDGQNIACNFLSWADGAAYSDWSGLRPMTELEFEKVCRGTVAAIPNEYAWGSTSITGATSIVNSGTATEETSPSNANCVYLDVLDVVGPLRVGSFARTNSSRQSSGASYYGVMEMSGNVEETIVTVGNSSGRSYTGNHGNGILNINGNSDIVNCPNETANGTGFRGGNWSDGEAYYLEVSERLWSGYTSDSRSYRKGFRCVGGE